MHHGIVMVTRCETLPREIATEIRPYDIKLEPIYVYGFYVVKINLICKNLCMTSNMLEMQNSEDTLFLQRPLC